MGTMPPPPHRLRRNLAILGPPKTIICANSENVVCNVGTYGCIDNSPTLCTSAAEQVKDATTAWVRAVTKKNNPRLVADQFCSDGILWGTVSQTIRGGNEVGGDIEKYFDYFAKLPGLTVKKAEDNVAQVTGDVFVNNANVKWNSDAFDAPVNARMTFLYRRDKSHPNGWCIRELHSSMMPELNEHLKEISGKARNLMNKPFKEIRGKARKLICTPQTCRDPGPPRYLSRDVDVRSLIQQRDVDVRSLIQQKARKLIFFMDPRKVS